MSFHTKFSENETEKLETNSHVGTSLSAQKKSEWKPRHMHEVVGITLVIHQWMKAKQRMSERQMNESSELAIGEVNASLVFEPMAVTMGRLRAIEQQRNQTLPSAENHQRDQAVQTAAEHPPPVAVEQLRKKNNENATGQNLRNGRAGATIENGGHHGTATAQTQGMTTRGTISICQWVRKLRTERQDWAGKVGMLLRTAVDPAGLFYCYWTLLVYAVFLYNAVVSVLFVFDDTQSEPRTFTAWISLNAFGDFVNLCDIFFNSRLSYMEDGMTIGNLKRLAKRYFRSALQQNGQVLPGRAISANDKCEDKLPKCFPNFAYSRRLYTLDLAAWEFNYVKNQDPVWADCITVLMRTEDGEDKCMFNETNRGDPDIERINYTPDLAAFWQNRSTKVPFSNFSKQYSLSFYWSSLTLTTSGQQPYPTAAMHNFLEIFDTIIGVLVFAVIVGSVGNAVSTMNLTRSELQQLNDGIKFYMNYRNVKDEMQKRVLDCIHYIRRHAQMHDERAILGSILPARLRGELAVHLHFETISRVQLFAHCETSLLYELVLRLKMQMFAPNDFLCRRGDLAKEMFVLKRGVLEIIDENECVEHLESGATFGEMSILKPTGPLGKLLARRGHSLRSLGYSEVYLLSQEDALEVFADYPEQRQMLMHHATQLLMERGEVGGAELVEPGPLDPLELCGTENSAELLQLLGNTLCGLDATLDALYDKFMVNSSELKQQITVLEGTYQRNRQKLRKKRHKKLCQK
ncbi:hypothetical protein niasHT_038432 [Heterodera trifolii]|uniref:Cyclic nucleotide-binding domain-containing protein n=1 Tax=Heterodera trifolii TaxID=157864 RepID=A0ABD2IQR5_9BILA